MSFKSGLLWFDDDPRKDLGEKVLRAAAHYERKYGYAPDLCYVHPSAFGENGNGKSKVQKIGTVEIQSGRSVLPHHFWLGITDKQKKAASVQPTSAPQPSLVRRVRATGATQGTMTPEAARQLLLELEERHELSSS
jgi:hypothetical protein